MEQGNLGAHPGVGRPGARGFSGPGATACSGFTDTGLTCANSSNLATGLLTSGYYGGEDRVKPGAFKCSHGGPLDKSSPSSDIFGYFREGINKDTLYCDLSPHSTFHNRAATAAIAGAQQFIEDLKAVLTVTQLKALLGAGPTLAFAIDTTGSMGGIIAGVRSSATNIVNNRLGTDEEPLQYVLAPFNDPFTGPNLQRFPSQRNAAAATAARRLATPMQAGRSSGYKATAAVCRYCAICVLSKSSLKGRVTCCLQVMSFLKGISSVP